MKIIVAFDNDIKSIRCVDSDIYVTDNYSYRERSNVVLIDHALCDEGPDLAASINDLFNSYPSEFLPFRNTFFMRVFRPIHSLIHQLECLIKQYKPEELILIGGSDCKFVSLIGAEGEGSYALYKPSWLFNPIIHEYFKDRIDIKWIKKKNANLFNLFYRMRESAFFSAKLVKDILRNVFKKNVIISGEEKPEVANVTAVVNLPLQYNHLSNLLQNEDRIDLKFLSPAGSAVRGTNVNKYKIRFKDYWSAINKFRKVRSACNAGRALYNINGKDISFDGMDLIGTVKLNFILFHSNISAMLNVLPMIHPANNVFLASNMTFGEDIILVNEVAKRTALKHYNFQAVTMSKMIFPQMRLADKFFLYAQRTYAFYKDMELSFLHYFPNFTSAHCDVGLKEDGKIVLTLFPQPDFYAERYLCFLEKILPMLQKQSAYIKLIIKPHYRQNRLTDFEKLARSHSFVEIENSRVLPEEVIRKSDFILSMTSSVLSEAIWLNCPGIIIDFDGLDRKFISENDGCFPNINFVINSGQDLLKIINDPIRYKSIYSSRRNDWYKNIQCRHFFDAGKDDR